MTFIGAILVLLPAAMAPSQWPNEWHGIVPLHSSRADVERLLGPGTGDCACNYHLDDFSASIVYSMGNCESGGSGVYNVPPDTVLRMTVRRKPAPLLSDLRLDDAKFEKRQLIRDLMEYVNRPEGLSLEVVNGRVEAFNYLPAERDNYLRCPGYDDVSFPADVPKEARSGLLETLDRFVEYLRTAQYEKEYRLYLPEFAALSFPVKDEEEFAKWARQSGFPGEGAVVEFKPESVNARQDKTFGDVYEIYGLAKTEADGKITEGHRVIRAALRGGQWYLVDIFRLPPG